MMITMVLLLLILLIILMTVVVVPMVVASLINYTRGFTEHLYAQYVLNLILPTLQT